MKVKDLLGLKEREIFGIDKITKEHDVNCIKGQDIGHNQLLNREVEVDEGKIREAQNSYCKNCKEIKEGCHLNCLALTEEISKALPNIIKVKEA